MRHHERIVDRCAGDFVNAFGFERFGSIDKSGKMLGRTSGGESAGNRKDRDAASFEKFVTHDGVQTVGDRKSTRLNSSHVD